MCDALEIAGKDSTGRVVHRGIESEKKLVKINSGISSRVCFLVFKITHVS